MFRIEHNLETGEIIEIPLTAEEIAEVQANQVKFEQDLQNAQDANAVKAALLDRLGITEEEAKLLLS